MLLLLLLMLPAASWSQTVKLIDATEQDWSGGIAGRSGTNYVFDIELKHCKKDVQPDTIWVGQSPTALSEKNTTQTHTQSGLLLQIRVTIQGKNSYGHFPEPTEPTPVVHAPCQYKGIALLSYHQDGKQYYYAIPRITKKYPHQSYP